MLLAHCSLLFAVLQFVVITRYYASLHLAKNKQQCTLSTIQLRILGSRHTSHIHEKGARNHPLTETHKSRNKEKSRVRARVEHVFGSMTNELGGITIRTIGHARAKVQIGLLNLVYNIKRVTTLIRKKHFGFDRVIAPKAA